MQSFNYKFLKIFVVLVHTCRKTYLWLGVGTTHVGVEAAELTEHATTLLTLKRGRVTGAWVRVHSLKHKLTCHQHSQ